MDRETFRNVIRNFQVRQQLGKELCKTVWELISLTLILIFTGLMFSFQEGWNVVDSIYFVFVTASVIGFGDFGDFYPAAHKVNVTREDCELYGKCLFESLCESNASNSTQCQIK